MSWQYNGVASWEDILGWCAKTLGKDWYSNGFETIVFEKESAYALFLLRWS